MKVNKTTSLSMAVALAAVLSLLAPGCVTAPGTGSSSKNARSLNDAASSALRDLYASQPLARDLARQSRAILIFPDVVKGGFMWGGEVGNGVLRQNGWTTGYYNLTAGSYGFQAGLQSFGYALFFMSDSALSYLRNSGGWEIGVGPSVVVLDEGLAKTLTTTTLRNDVYAFVFDQSGLMAGAGLQGSKITQVQP